MYEDVHVHVQQFRYILVQNQLMSCVVTIHCSSSSSVLMFQVRILTEFFAEQILAELLTLDPTPARRGDVVSPRQQSLHHLQRVEFAEAIQRETQYEPAVHRPARVTRIHKSAAQLGKELTELCLAGRQ